MITGPNIANDGLVFYYDTGNTRKSFLGEPTVNLITPNGIDMSVQSIYTDLVNTQVSDNEASLGYACEMEILSETINGSARIKFGDATNIPTTGFVFVSIYCKIIKSQQNIQPGIFSGVAWYGLDPLDGGSSFMTNEYRRFGAYVEVGTGSGGPNPGFSMTVYDDNIPKIGDKTRWHSPQVELLDHPTPFTPDTRTVTDSLLDLTKNTTIDVTNTSFDSNGQMFFDGVDDYITSQDTFSFSNDFSIEIWFKWGKYGTSTIDFLCGGVSEQLEIHLGGIGVNGLRFIPNTHSGSTVDIYNALKYDGFHQCVVVYNKGVSSEAYINGQLEGTKVHSISSPTTDSNLFIGKRVASSYNFDGQIPITKIYNRALTPQEVKRNFNSTKSRFNIT